MKLSNKILTIFFATLLSACTSKKQEGVLVSDESIWSIARTVSSFSYLHNRTDTLIADPATNGSHGNFVRIRFNQKALSAMNDSLSGLSKTFFPNGSLILKEIYDQSGGNLIDYAVMYKSSDAANSGSGWIWVEYNPDGGVEYSGIRKGDLCISCHARGNNADLVQTFLYH